MSDASTPNPEAAEPAASGDASVAGAATAPGSDSGAGAADSAPGDRVADGDAVAPEISVEDLVVDLERVSVERDEYLDALRRLQAEFENYRKAVSKREADARARANDKIVTELLPVLDACDGAVVNGAADVEPIRKAIIDNLSRQGLERLEPAGDAFDPELHEAVLHEDSSDVDVPTVAEVLRVGYGWNGRVLRPAMVKTIG
jgi:molecular chaperone GrpE